MFFYTCHMPNPFPFDEFLARNLVCWTSLTSQNERKGTRNEENTYESLGDDSEQGKYARQTSWAVFYGCFGCSADGMLFGALASCPMCQSPVEYGDGQYKCKGFLTAWSKCSYTTLAPKRKPGKWKISGLENDFLDQVILLPLFEKWGPFFILICALDAVCGDVLVADHFPTVPE